MCLEVLVVGGCAVNFVDSVRVLVGCVVDAGVDDLKMRKKIVKMTLSR